MSTTIFFEGGGSTEATQSRHRRGLSEYIAKVNPKLSRLRINASGGREQTFDDFKLAMPNCRVGEIVVLLVDSETPVTAATGVEHLRANDNWIFPNLGNHCVFLMVQTMESWFLADRNAMQTFYDGGFSPKSLPGSPSSVETIRKEDVASGLKAATAKTKTKGAYHKIEHGCALLGLIDPTLVEKGSPHAKQFHDFLRAL